MICSDPLCNILKIAPLSLFSFIGNFSLRSGVTARGHFASNSAYPCQASSSVFNCLPNWLGFMVRRVGLYSRYFSRLEEAGTRAISIIDIEKKARSGLGDFSFIEGPYLVSLSRFDIALLSYPSSLKPCAFSRFSPVISREKNHHPWIKISRILDRISCADYLSSGQIMISYIDHSSSVKMT